MEDPDLGQTQRLLTSARGGDGAALDELFERYYPRVVRIVSLRLGKSLREFTELEDVVQESLLRTLGGLGAFEPRSEGSFRNWLATIVENTIRDQDRRVRAVKRGGGRAPRRAAGSSSLLSGSILAGREPTPSQAAEAGELEERLEGALLALDERSRRVIELRRLCGLSYDEIAEELGLGAASSARALLARAMTRLSDLL